MLATARQIYEALKNDSAALARLDAERASLAEEIATSDKGGLDLTSATVNGQSFAGTRSMTKRDRLTLLSLVGKMASEGVSISSTGYVSHPTGNG